ncbi:MAG: ABC transporter ATP-binding protein [Propionibacterium sp.]|nr:ABC transporter ATP-binding protein [Propionibacterium sp.]
MSQALVLESLTAVRGAPLFTPIDYLVQPGTLLGIVGPNGAGKSSLLGAIAGTGGVRQGVVRYGSKDLARLPSRHRARTISLMNQESTAPNELRAIDVVGIGAQAGAAANGSAADVAHHALASLEIEHLAMRVCSTLSGGERQLVQVARVLAQGAPVMLLDEPTSALDLGHQLTVMHALHERAAAGHIVVVTMHDLTQALRWATLIALVSSGTVEIGAPESVIHPDVVRKAYGVEAEVFDSPTGSPTLSLVRPKGLSPVFPVHMMPTASRRS